MFLSGYSIHAAGPRRPPSDRGLMVRLQCRYAFLVHIALFLAAGAARAEELVPAAPTDSMPGSSVPPGLGLAPESPPVPPAPGGRAPSFGAPAPPSASSFRLGGKLWGTEAVGIGRTPCPAAEDYSGTALHLPALMTSKSPVWSGAGANINIHPAPDASRFSYGTGRYAPA